MKSIDTDASLEFLCGATVAPLTNLVHAKAGIPGTFDGGVYYGNGSVCEIGRQIKSSYKNLPTPATDLSYGETLNGIHLFGGMIQNGHFGHFMAESLARLWATVQTSNIDSIVFYLRTPGKPIPQFEIETFKLLGLEQKITVIEKATRVEELIVPSQLGHRTQGFVNGHRLNKLLFDRLRKYANSTAEKIYVSRSRLKPYEGGILLESLIEENLIREGYEVIHPQELTIEQQLNYYNNASSIIFSEGSAIHLYALVARPDQSVYVVWRRKKGPIFDWQVRSFGGARLFGDPHVVSMFVPDIGFGAMVRAKAVLNFCTLSADLKKNGFIRSEIWQQPDHPQLTESISELERKNNYSYIDRRIVDGNIVIDS